MDYGEKREREREQAREKVGGAGGGEAGRVRGRYLRSMTEMPKLQQILDWTILACVLLSVLEFWMVPCISKKRL